jgi:hypothetical protein
MSDVIVGIDGLVVIDGVVHVSEKVSVSMSGTTVIWSVRH